MKKIFIKSSRDAVFYALNEVEKEGAYSNLIIDKLLKESSLDQREKNFAGKMFYGVLEYKLTLDHCILRYIKKGAKGLQIEVLSILRMGFYELLFMDSSKAYATVSESVNLCRRVGINSASGLVNAVMRSFLRDEKDLKLPDKEKSARDYYCIKYSCPKWLFKSFEKDYGIENAINICRTSTGTPPVTIRVNRAKISVGELALKFNKSGIEMIKHPFFENCAEIRNTGSINSLKEYKGGYFHVQDFSSQLCAAIAASLSEQNGDIFDLCAAPGGKTFTIAQNLPAASVYASDIHKSRVELIIKGAERLGLNNVRASISDASEYDGSLGKAGVVLCDVPCSGFGIIGRKPEIKYKPKNKIEDLDNIQYSILRNALKYVKDGGFLVYSTCTLRKRENEDIIKRFILEYKDLEIYNIFSCLTEKIRETVNIYTSEYGITIFPFNSNFKIKKENKEFSDMSESDGFFISVLRKI